MDSINRISIDLDDLAQCFPQTSGFDITKHNSEVQKRYLEEYSVYRTWYTEFLIRLLKLNDYDLQISESELKFKPVLEDKMDVYQFFLRDKLKYLYIRNNIYIEKLTEEERSFMQKFLSDNCLPYNDEIDQFIKKTFKKLIFEDITRKGDKIQVMYGPDSQNYMARNDAIVIGFRYDEWNMDGLSDEEWDELDYKRKFDFLPDLFQNILQEALEKKIEVPVQIIKYNDFSIRTRGKENSNRKEGEEK